MLLPSFFTFTFERQNKMAEVDFSDFADFDPETIDQGGQPKPGKAMLLVTAIEDKGEFVKVVSEIVAHEDETQVGKSEYNIINKTGKGAKRAFLFGLATGVITRQDLAEAKEAGTSIDIPFESTYSKVYLGTLVKSSYQGKDKCRVEWDFRPLDHPEAKEYPSNPEYAGAASGGDQNEGGNDVGDDDVPF